MKGQLRLPFLFLGQKMDNLIILQGITVDQLLSKLEAIVERKIAESLNQNPARKTEKYMTRKEVAEFLHISLPTLHDWTKMEWIKSYRIGSRVLFKSDEVEAALKIRKFRRI